MEGPICRHCGCPERFGTALSIDRALQREHMDRIFYRALSEDSIDLCEASQKRRGGNIL